MNTKKTAQAIASLAITLVFVWWLVNYFTAEDLMQSLGRITFQTLAIGFLIYIITYIFRAIRFYVLLNKKNNKQISLSKLFSIVCLHTFIGNIVPFRIGELSFLYFAKKEGIPLKKSGPSLVLARVLDGLAVLLLFTILSFLIEIPEVAVLRYWALAIFLIVLAKVILIVYKGGWFKKIFKILTLNKLKKLSVLVDKVIDSFSYYKDKKTLLAAFSVSILLWISLLSAFYIVVNPHLNLSYSAVMLGLIFPSVVAILPIQGFAGAGTTEGGFIIGFLLVGLTTSMAASMSITYHTTALLFLLCAGIIGGLIYYLQSRK